MDTSIRLRRPGEQLAARGRSADEIMLEVAQEFKYLLDVQPVRSLFNPGGAGDARDSASYARAARLLDQAIAQSNNGSASPRPVLGCRMAVVDFEADAGRQTPSQTLDVLKRVRESLLGLGLNECDQGNGGCENRCPLEIRIRTLGQADQIFKFSQGMGNAVHSVSPENVVGRTLCHAEKHACPIVDEDDHGNR